MGFSFFYMTCAATTSLFALLVTLSLLSYKKFKFPKNNKTEDSTTLSLSPPPCPLPRNWIHNVFTSFHGADVRKSFLSHFLEECKSKGIDPFIDNEIKRGEFIGPELKKAIHGSSIAIVLLSKNYASSSWCLDELVEIMKCNENLAYTVMAIFYEVDPSDVKKQAGDFGKVFKKTCKGKTKEVIGKWSRALAKVATIAGYHSSNSENDVKLIEKIVTDVSAKLFSSTRSRDFDGFVGIGAHMEKMEQVLDLGPIGVDEVKMIGIWGSPGIGKTTIARCVFNEHSGSFDLSVFMTNVKALYTAPLSSDDYDAKLSLQQKFLSKITNQKEGFKITHLGSAQERLHDKRVLVVLDNVDQLVQLEALAKESLWFGHGSRIIVTTQDQNILRAHGINHVYKVNVPTESLQIFCMYAFKQKSPPAGFEKLAWEVTLLAGQLPLGLRVIGSSFRGKSKQQWEDALPNLRSNLDGQIEKILKFSYDALSQREKDLFLHITCFFNSETVESLEEYLAKMFSGFRQGIDVLIDRSLISVFPGNTGRHVVVNSLLVQLGREIVRKEYHNEPGKYTIRKPGDRQFLVDTKDFCEVLSDDTTDCSSVIGIYVTLSETEDELYLTERAFERMSNLKFLRVYGDCDRFYYPQILNSISRKLRLLIWHKFPMPCFPTNFDPKFLITLCMEESKLEKLWDGVKPLRNLKDLSLRYSRNLKKLPNLSTATKLETLRLGGCSSLTELPSSIGNATNLKSLYLYECSSLMKLPSSLGDLTNLTALHLTGCSILEELPLSIGDLTNLKVLNLADCSNLVELPLSIGDVTNLKDLKLADCSNLVELPSSVGNLQKLKELNMNRCLKVKVLPININLGSLDWLSLTDCSLLTIFPDISTNVSFLDLRGTAIAEVPPSISLWSRLDTFRMLYCENLKESPHAFDSITELHLTDTGIQEIGPWVKGFSRLRRLVLNDMPKLVSLPQLPDSLLFLDAENCGSLERLDCSFANPDIRLNFQNCFKLNQEARDLIIHTSNRTASIFPGGEVPAYFSVRTTGGTLTMKLSERPPHKSLRFKACIVLGDDVDGGDPNNSYHFYASYKFKDKQNGLLIPCRPSSHSLPPALGHSIPGHFYTFEFEAFVTSDELIFEISAASWAIKECGLRQLS